MYLEDFFVGLVNVFVKMQVVSVSGIISLKIRNHVSRTK